MDFLLKAIPSPSTAAALPTSRAATSSTSSSAVPPPQTATKAWNPNASLPAPHPGVVGGKIVKKQRKTPGAPRSRPITSKGSKSPVLLAVSTPSRAFHRSSPSTPQRPSSSSLLSTSSPSPPPPLNKQAQSAAISAAMTRALTPPVSQAMAGLSALARSSPTPTIATLHCNWAGCTDPDPIFKTAKDLSIHVTRAHPIEAHMTQCPWLLHSGTASGASSPTSDDSMSSSEDSEGMTQCTFRSHSMSELTTHVGFHVGFPLGVASKSPHLTIPTPMAPPPIMGHPDPIKLMSSSQAPAKPPAPLLVPKAVRASAPPPAPRMVYSSTEVLVPKKQPGRPKNTGKKRSRTPDAPDVAAIEFDATIPRFPTTFSSSATPNPTAASIPAVKRPRGRPPKARATPPPSVPTMNRSLSVASNSSPPLGTVPMDIDNDNSFACQEEGCSKSFSRKTDLARHMTAFHSRGEDDGKPKPYVCSWPGCDKAYTRKAHLIHHQYIHDGKRPFECTWDGCTSSFVRPSDLRRHMLTHTGEKRYACVEPGCKMSFTRRDNLQYHCIRKHGAAPHSPAPRSPSPAVLYMNPKAGQPSPSQGVLTGARTSPGSAPPAA